MERLFDPEKPHFSAWIWLYDMDHHWREPMLTSHPTRPGAVPLYYAALCGFYGLADHLTHACPSDVNARGGRYVTPLHAALNGGHRKVMVLLLQRGADVEIRDKGGSTPLHRASERGNLDIMRLL
jgi:ankyrin repeat protein